MNPSSPLQEWLTNRLADKIGHAPLRIRLWNGAEIAIGGQSSVGTIWIKDRPALLKLILDPDLHFGDAYTSGKIQVEGDLPEMLTRVFRAMAGQPAPHWYPRLISAWLDRRQANSLRGSRHNIHRHYDIGTDFYKLWLDRQLVYTCAYFADPKQGLEEAQVAKMHHVCRKVGLRPGDAVVEAGCGWGALALHMARYYGVTVRAYNISRMQIAYARRWAKEEGLEDRVEFIEDDYRNISGRYDVFMSVGMLEHVGIGHYGELGRVIHQSLKESGRGLLHFIGRNRASPLSSWIRKRIFPGAYPPTLQQAMTVLDDWDFSVLDIENIRLHYARTLEHWLERFEESTEKVAAMFDQEFVRAWRLYLAGSIAGFRAGSLQLFQITFARGTNNQIPWTRMHLYTE